MGLGINHSYFVYDLRVMGVWMNLVDCGVLAILASSSKKGGLESCRRGVCAENWLAFTIFG
jgi:hypothetical protein